MHGNDRPCLRRQRADHRLGGQVERQRIHIGEDGAGTYQRHRAGRRHEGVGGHDDLVVAPKRKEPKRKHQGRCTRAGSDAAPARNLEPCGELLFERGCLGTEDELLMLETAGNRLLNLRLAAKVEQLHVEQGDRHHRVSRRRKVGAGVGRSASARRRQPSARSLIPIAENAEASCSHGRT